MHTVSPPSFKGGKASSIISKSSLLGYPSYGFFITHFFVVRPVDIVQLDSCDCGQATDQWSEIRNAAKQLCKYSTSSHTCMMLLLLLRMRSSSHMVCVKGGVTHWVWWWTLQQQLPICHSLMTDLVSILHHSETTWHSIYHSLKSDLLFSKNNNRPFALVMSLVRRVRGLKIPRRLVLTTGNSVNRFPRLLVYRHLKLPMFSTSFRTPTLQ